MDDDEGYDSDVDFVVPDGQVARMSPELVQAVGTGFEYLVWCSSDHPDISVDDVVAAKCYPTRVLRNQYTLDDLLEQDEGRPVALTAMGYRYGSMFGLGLFTYSADFEINAAIYLAEVIASRMGVLIPTRSHPLSNALATI